MAHMAARPSQLPTWQLATPRTPVAPAITSPPYRPFCDYGAGNPWVPPSAWCSISFLAVLACAPVRNPWRDAPCSGAFHNSKVVAHLPELPMPEPVAAAAAAVVIACV